jgi:hypothetical protein
MKVLQLIQSPNCAERKCLPVSCANYLQEAGYVVCS